MFECTPSRSAQVWDVFRNPHPWVIERWCAGIKGPPRQEVLSHNEGSGEVCCRALLHNLLLGKMVWRALYLWVLWRWFGGPCSYELHNTQSFNIAELLIFPLVWLSHDIEASNFKICKDSLVLFIIVLLGTWHTHICGCWYLIFWICTCIFFSGSYLSKKERIFLCSYS